MRRSSRRQARMARPGMEGLEVRQLLSTGVDASGGAPTSGRALDGQGSQGGASVQDRQIKYTTPQGAHVVITLYGVGSLAGSSVDPDGALNLVFDGTNESTGIVGRVSGGGGQAPLRSIQNAALGLGNFSGIGSTVLNVVNLKNFNLVDGGQINLTGGVHTLFLNSAGTNTQIHLRQLPSSLTTSSSSSGTSTATVDGITYTYNTNTLTDATTLALVAGRFSEDFQQQLALSAASVNPSGIIKTGPPPPPPGVVLSIGRVAGAPRTDSALSDPEVYGYDPTANALILFDAADGAELKTIPLAGAGTMTTGVALGRDHGQLVALVGNGSTVFAFNALTGAPVGSFSTTDLASGGLASIDGIGSTDNRTVLLDSTTLPGGAAQAINLSASLDSGHAVALGSPFTPTREFAFSGGLTGVAGSNQLYAGGAAHFDSAQPSVTQLGFMALKLGLGGQLSESSRTALQSNGSDINGVPNPNQALGSIDQSLALDTGVSNGQNVIELLDPSTLSSQGTVKFQDPNLLTGLSESFRPDLVDSALVDIQGDLQSFRSNYANGLVLNVAGFANLVKISSVANSTFVALPFGHAQMPDRNNNVTIVSTKRPVGERNGVTVNPNLNVVGPLSLPTPDETI